MGKVINAQSRFNNKWYTDISVHSVSPAARLYAIMGACQRIIEKDEMEADDTNLRCVAHHVRALQAMVDIHVQRHGPESVEVSGGE